MSVCNIIAVGTIRKCGRNNDKKKEKYDFGLDFIVIFVSDTIARTHTLTRHHTQQRNVRKFDGRTNTFSAHRSPGRVWNS